MKTANTSSSSKFKILTILLGVGAIILIITAVFMWFIPPGYSVTTYSMESYVNQTIYGKNREEAAEEAADKVAMLENKISWRIAGSEVERLNLNAGTNFLSIDEDVISILKTCREVSEKSAGAFDVTIAPLSRLWGFGDAKNTVPQDELIQKILPYTDYNNILFNEKMTQVALKTKTTTLDLSLIAQGAACDEAVKVYEEEKASSAVITVGSTIGLFGEKWFGLPWQIEIQNPSGEETIGKISMQAGFISTAANYQNYFEEDGKVYHSILDPKTGYPAESGLVSVTVTAESGVLSQALAQACFVLGYESSLPLLQDYNAEAVFVTEAKEVYITSGLKNQFKHINQEYQLIGND
ncbi:FAD:protein FMN transferase [Scatolibacter rhodanostii]|uniref:FAD:protein FMN transferase n=1 Tax=Scatolibacter rhodanostii TaxID=2014781 RepID=UPI000C06C837|nr:FAD:protein FMN transferase [Scatolibacter rhodanostii]